MKNYTDTLIESLLQEFVPMKPKPTPIPVKSKPDTDYAIWIWRCQLNGEEYMASAELNSDSKWDGIVFKSKPDAEQAAALHLRELEEEDELDGHDPDEFTITVFALPYTAATDDTLEFSGLGWMVEL